MFQVIAATIVAQEGELRASKRDWGLSGLLQLTLQASKATQETMAMITAVVKPIPLPPAFRACFIRFVTSLIMDSSSEQTTLPALVLGTAAPPGAVGTGVISRQGCPRNGVRIGLRICASRRVGGLALQTSAAGSFHGPEHENDGDANHRDQEDDCIGYISVHAMLLRRPALPVCLASVLAASSIITVKRQGAWMTLNFRDSSKPPGRHACMSSQEADGDVVV